MLLFGVANDQLQQLRDEGWDSLMNDLSIFCVKYDILIYKLDEFYSILLKSRRRVIEHTILHHYGVEVFYIIID